MHGRDAVAGEFSRILDVDPVSRTARVQCGVRNQPSAGPPPPAACNYAPDPSGGIACHGGNVAENSGGVHCLKYGLTVHNVLRVRGLHHGGRAVTFGLTRRWTRARLPDLLAAVIGSEGVCWRVALEATVPHPQPAAGVCIMKRLRRRRCARPATPWPGDHSQYPARLEMMDKPMTAAVEDFVKAGYDRHGRRPFCCARSDSTRPRWRKNRARARCCAAHTAISVSADETERMRRFWSQAQERLPASGRYRPRLHVHGLSTIPRKRLAVCSPSSRWRRNTACAAAACYSTRATATCTRWSGGSANDYDSCTAAAAFRRRHPGETSVAMGGGDGRARRGRGEAQQHVHPVHGRGRAARMVAGLKHAFDPAGAAQPGKIPTLNRCAEYGKMLVR